LKPEVEIYSPFVRGYLSIIVKNLKGLRGEMSKRAFAKKTGVSLTTIDRMEKGRNFEIVSLFKIAESFGISPFDLCLTDEEKIKIRMVEEDREDRIAERVYQKIRAEKSIK